MLKSILTIFFSVICFQAAGFEINCPSEPLWQQNANDDLYTFEVIQQCTIKITQPNLKDAKDLYLKNIIKQAQTYYGSKDVKYKSLKGKRLDVTDFFSTDQGDLTIRSYTYVLSNKNFFIYKFKSQHIHATGNAGYTRRAHIKVQVKKISNAQYALIIEKEVDVEKPFAPEFLFVSIVKKGLLRDLEDLVVEHKEYLTQSLSGSATAS